MNIGKAIDKMQGNEREVIGEGKYFNRQPHGLQGTTITNFKDSIGKKYGSNGVETKGNTEWEGWGTALKPAHEPIVLARKPLSEKTVAENVLKWGTGALNIDGCRIATDELTPRNNNNTPSLLEKGFEGEPKTIIPSPLGRFPSNFIHDGSEEVVELFPDTKTGDFSQRGQSSNTEQPAGWKTGPRNNKDFKGDSGSASRFFYCAKASKSERNAGCDGLEEKQSVGGGGGIGDYLDDVNSASGKYGSEKAPAKNNHPTVKPIKLMEYLIKLVTPPGGIVLDPFTGSGTTGVASVQTHHPFIGFELGECNTEISNARIAYAVKNTIKPLEGYFKECD